MNSNKDSLSADTLYADTLGEVPKFSFDQSVVDVFPDMIKRSVPGYTTILSIIGQIAERYAQADSHCYDLGCSLGAGLLAMRHRIHADNVTIVGVDNSEDMIERCKMVIEADSAEPVVELLQHNILDITLKPMSVCLLNFTLQFVEPNQRKTLIQSIADAMLPGGVLVLSEKLNFDNQEHQELMIDLHHNFKRANGYSDLEIAQKREAIEDVLIPENFETHKNRLIQSGFRSADLWFQCFNFSSIIAIK